MLKDYMKNIGILIFLAFFLISFVSAVQVCQVYDDFSSGVLNASKWEIRQDVEGQPFTDEYWVDSNLSNFHIKENIIGDKRTYLFPKHTFTTGNILEYDFNVLSKEGNYMQMNLLTGDQYIRVGIMGYSNGVQGYDELGTSHIKIEFQENNVHLERTSPSNVTLIDNLHLTNTNGDYQWYIGAGSGHNGRMHIDLDNFVLCTEQPEPPQPTELELRVTTLEQKVAGLEQNLSILQQENQELKNNVSSLNLLVNKLINFIKKLPQGLSKLWVD